MNITLTVPHRRIDTLEALRGVAICSIIFVSIPQVMGMMLLLRF